MKRILSYLHSLPLLRSLQSVSFAISFVLLLFMCRGLFSWLAEFVFNEPREDMAHGWIVPVFSLAILWIKRKEISASLGHPSWLGLLATVPAIFLFLLGTLGDQVRITQIGAIALLGALFYAVWGFKLLNAVAFAVAYLLFTVPMSFLDAVTIKLRFVIAVIASIMLNGFGIPVQRSGTGLYCLSGEGFNLDIADPCSGLRSIFALMALMAAYAYLTQRTRRGKWLLFLSSVPVAMLGNLARIFTIALVARFFGQAAATGFYHDYSGFVVFLVAVLIMIWLGGVVSRLFASCEKLPAKQEPKNASTENTSLRIKHIAVLVILPILIFLSFIHIKRVPAPQEESADFLRESLTSLPNFNIKYPIYCQNEQCGRITEVESYMSAPDACPSCNSSMDRISLGEKNILPKDTIFLKGNYYDAVGDAWRITVVVNGKSRQSIHRPEICLPAQGLSIENGHIENFVLNNGKKLAVHCMDIRSRSSQSASRQGHGYFFVSRDTCAASHLKRILISVRDRAFKRRITRWAMVTISNEESFTISKERREATVEFLSEFWESLFVDEKDDGGIQ